MARAEPWARLQPLPTPLPRWVLAVAWLLALAFATTGLGKALDVVGFAGILGDFDLFPEGMLLPLAVLVTGLEFGIAGGLLHQALRPRAALAAMALAACNALILLVTLWRGIALQNCGCFGVFWARPLTLTSPLEDLVLIILGWLVWRGARQ